MYSEQDLYIKKQLEKEKINNNTIDFFVSLIEIFKTTEIIDSTSKKLATAVNKSERSVQRYVKALQEHGYIHVKPIWNNENPDKPYRVKNIYSLTARASNLVDKGSHYMNRHKNVYFQNKSLA